MYYINVYKYIYNVSGRTSYIFHKQKSIQLGPMYCVNMKEFYALIFHRCFSHILFYVVLVKGNVFKLNRKCHGRKFTVAFLLLYTLFLSVLGNSLQKITQFVCIWLQFKLNVLYQFKYSSNELVKLVHNAYTHKLNKLICHTYNLIVSNLSFFMSQCIFVHICLLIKIQGLPNRTLKKLHKWPRTL